MNNFAVQKELRLTDIFSYLMQKHPFRRVHSVECQEEIIVYFLENLEELVIEDTSVPISKIKRIEKGFSREMQEMYAEKDCLSSDYSLQIVTNSKTLDLICSTVLQRDNWLTYANLLLSVAKEKSVSSCMRAESLIESNQSEIDELLNQRLKNTTKLEQLDFLYDQYQAKLISDVLYDTISQIEEAEYKKDSNIINKQNWIIQSQIEVLEGKFKRYQQMVNKKNQEIASIVKYINQLQFNVKADYITKALTKPDPNIWNQVIKYCSFSDLVNLQSVAKFFRKIVGDYLKAKENWVSLAKASLSPRDVSWNCYLNMFYSTSVPTIFNEIPSNSLVALKANIRKNVVAHNKEIEELVMFVCALRPDIGYFPNLEKIVYYLYSKFMSTSVTLQCLVTLFDPPYFLGNLDMDRFSISLIACVKFKLPLLYKHFKHVGLDLTQITDLWVQQRFMDIKCYYHEDVIDSAWDLYIVNGIHGLLVASLTLLSLGQAQVLSKDKKRTLQIYQNKLQGQLFRTNIHKFYNIV